MYTQAARNRYAADAVVTASPAKLLTMLYDRLVRDLVQGEQAQRDGDRPAAHAALVHAQDILMELHSTLKVDVWEGGPGLAALYLWMHSELVAANVAGDADRTATVRGLVEPLREAWHQAANELAATPAAGRPFAAAAV